MLKIEGQSNDLIVANIELKQRWKYDFGHKQHSDNAIVLPENADGEEFDVYEKWYQFDIADCNQSGVCIVMHFSDRGVWTAEIGPVTYQVIIPWNVTVSTNDGSTVVTVDCPIGTMVDVTRWPV